MEDTLITRSNFKVVRRLYKIKLKEVAGKCCLSPQTVSNFENSTGLYSSINARDYNSTRMIKALQSLVDIRKERMMNEELEKKNKVKTKVSRVEHESANSHKPTIVRREDFTKNLKLYLSKNKLSLMEFCYMCGVAHGVFTPGYIKKNPFLSIKHLNKIKEATGWSEEQIKSGSFVEEVNDMSWVATEKSKAAMVALASESKKESTAVKLEDKPASVDSSAKVLKMPKLDPSVQMNVRYVFQDGQYYKEYDIVKHVSESISKEDFLKAMEG